MSNKKTMSIIYISGAITGHPPDEIWQKFENAEKLLMAKGYEVVVNPVRLVANTFGSDATMRHSWATIMRLCLIKLFICHEIYMLSGWQSSKEATLERYIAQQLDMDIIYG